MPDRATTCQRQRPAQLPVVLIGEQGCPARIGLPAPLAAVLRTERRHESPSSFSYPRAVKQSNFNDYQALRMSAAPKIEIHIINSGNAIGGAGEPGTPGVAPALANAIYDATGLRVRRLPLNAFDFEYQFEETDTPS